MAPAPSTVIRFARWLNRCWPLRTGRRRPSDPRHELGRYGEKLAARYLRSCGYKILYRNFQPKRGGGEVDLVCRQRNILVFVEVKTRRSTAYGRPAEAVDAEKQELVSRGARAWLRLLGIPGVVYRFDIVEVVAEPGRKPVCTLIENAFSLPEGEREVSLISPAT